MTDRPKEFDDRIMKYRPGLLKLAAKLGYRGEARVDIVTDTICYCLEHWQNFREEGGIWNWLYWQMRGQHSNKNQKKTVHLVEAGVQYGAAATSPNQQRYAELSQVLRRLSTREGGVLVRRAMGDGLAEIADDMGLSRQRVQQLELKARASLDKVA